MLYVRYFGRIKQLSSESRRQSPLLESLFLVREGEEVISE